MILGQANREREEKVGAIMNLKLIPQAAFDSGLLNADYHDRLLADVETFAKKAGVPLSAVWMPLSQYCDKSADYEWVRTIKASTDGGLLYLGKHKVPVEEKMRAIAGACLRNYTDARVMSVQDVIKRLKGGEMAEPSVLLIPNFCIDKAEGGDIASWEVSQLLGLLIDRASQGKKTVLYAASWLTLEKQYGTAFKEHLELYYAVHSSKGYSLPKVNETAEA